MQSELQVHANSVHFLCDVPKNTSSISSDNKSNAAPPAFPPSIILYLLWKPNTYPTPRSFADGPLSECVRQCLLANGEEAPDTELEDARTSPRTSPYSPRRQSFEQQLSVEAREEMRKKSDPLDAFVNLDYGNDGSKGRESASEIHGGIADSNLSEKYSQTQQQKNQKEQITKIYVVVDRISPSDMDESLNGFGELPSFPDIVSSSTSNESNKQVQPIRKPSQSTSTAQQQLNQQNNEIRTAEKLARAVASSSFLRSRIDGISIGITSDARAAPGLEACMDTVERGAKERRVAARSSVVKSVMRKMKKVGIVHDVNDDFCSGDESMRHFRRAQQILERVREQSPERSPIAIVAMQPDDLDSGDYHDHSHHHDHTEHVEKVLQCRVSTEWNGKGEHKTFSDRAMTDWRQAWCGGGSGENSNNESDGASNTNDGIRFRPKVPRISRRGREEVEEESDIDEPISTAMVIVFLAVMAAYTWSSYGDFLRLIFIGKQLEKS